MNGYILESKGIIESDIWGKPPLYFKVWHYLLLKATYADTGKLKRGQLFTSIPEIAEACSYYKGFQKITPSNREIWSVIEYLRRNDEGNCEGDMNVPMVVTTKVTHGMLVTICNYNKYQDPRTYESNNERNYERDTKVITYGSGGNNIINKYNKKNNKKNLIEREKKEKDDGIFSTQHKQFAEIKAMLAAGAKEGTHE